ncbi:MAG: hypothetical protein ING71_17505, partial [Rhodocyclaceae bacterium]|nr:hypothetical protein [Rhodocyclaceae bacterium]
MHSFDPKIAEVAGIAPAVIYQNICWWIAKNKANGDNLIDGHYWTYNSVRAFAVLFPYLTEDQVRRALDRLVECGLIVVGNHNKSAYDRTKWFRLSDQMDLADLPNEIGEIAEPIPVVNAVGKPVVTDTIVSVGEKPKSTRGSRIPEDWQPSQDDYNQALNMGLTVEKVDNEANKFRDYWISKAGKDAVKLNWSATWRNWCRTAKDRSRAPSYSNTNRDQQKSGSRVDAALR